ncbi:hypothetical protein K435DRAFT_816619 [Dendrothele bispora CBS 962.96]|uniref:Pali-domain-containing protein n=1 Tax=Dendrothele bispora (strain CBS 962.96) TaxID=1314807 RepID=A0A4S8MRQ7_DENBC|nr:hypothetical protein K435DRAFT_816619 [Dendrothele bispora CBS 962.96]
MRKISYALTFIAVVISLIFVHWLVVKSPKIIGRFQIITTYGLNKVCELKLYDDSGHQISGYDCRKFPLRVQDGCEKENSGFCAAWTSAGYALELSIGFAALSLFTILIGVSTGSRRRRIWKAVAGMVALHATFGIVAFGVVTDVNRTGAYPSLEYAKPGIAYGFNTFAWVFSVIVAAAVVITGISAEKGHKWAAGNRAYRRIDG